MTCFSSSSSYSLFSFCFFISFTRLHANIMTTTAITVTTTTTITKCFIHQENYNDLLAVSISRFQHGIFIQTLSQLVMVAVAVVVIVVYFDPNRIVCLLAVAQCYCLQNCMPSSRQLGHFPPHQSMHYDVYAHIFINKCKYVLKCK